MLEAIVPGDGPHPSSESSPEIGQVWLWVNGGLDAEGIGGHDATPYIAESRAELERANVNTKVVHLLSKPHVRLPAGEALRPALNAALQRYEKLGLPLSVNFDGHAMARLLRAP